MKTVRELPSSKLACVITYGAMRRNVSEGEVFGVYDMHDIPDVGEFKHWNMKKVQPVYLDGGKYCDIRTGKPVKTEKNGQVWPLFTGTVLEYPDGKKLLLSRRFNKECSILLLDISGEERPTATTTLTVKGC